MKPDIQPSPWTEYKNAVRELSDLEKKFRAAQERYQQALVRLNQSILEPDVPDAA